MPDERKKRMVSVKLDEATIACLDSLAEKIGITRSGMAVRIIHESLPEIKVLNSIGVLRWGSWLEWVITKVKEHGSPQMTQRYAHLADEALARAASVANDIFGENKNGSLE